MRFCDTGADDLETDIAGGVIVVTDIFCFLRGVRFCNTGADDLETDLAGRVTAVTGFFCFLIFFSFKVFLGLQEEKNSSILTEVD